MFSRKSLLYSCLFTLLCSVALTSYAYAQSPGDELEREAQAIDRMIMCPVCPAETIDQAQVEISFQMRAVIREMLAEGRSREEILDYFVDRYGPDILAAPPKTGANLLAWILPIVGVALGLGGVLLVIRAMTGRSRPTPHATAADDPAEPGGLAGPPDADLAPYLEITDRLLVSRRAALAGHPLAAHPATEPEPDSASLPPAASGEPMDESTRNHG